VGEHHCCWQAARVGVDRKGRVRLSMKAVNQEQQAAKQNA
jgi:hypothetical protein